MGVFKRAITSVIQRKVNSIILLVIVFILANVLLTTLSVNSSIKSTKDSVLSQLTPAVTIDINPKIWEDSDAVMPPITAKMATELYESTKNIVKTFDYSQSSGMTVPSGFKDAEILSEEQQKKITGESDSTFSASLNERLYVYVTGTQLAVKPEAEGNGKLLSGNGFSQSDIENGNYKILVSKQFAETNGLEVGSKVVLSSEIYSNTESDTMTNVESEAVQAAKVLDYEFEVSGIIQIDKIEEFIHKANKKDVSKLVDEYYQITYLASQVYMPNVAVNKISDASSVAYKEINPEMSVEAEEIESSFLSFVQPQYILNDMKDLAKFKKIAISLFSEDKYLISSASDTYDIAAKPLETMGDLLDTIFIITVIASIVILALVLCIFMYLRQKEMGIFLALGERKTKIIGQLLCETLIVALIGATLAIFTSIIFSNMLADSALQSLLAPSSDVMNEMSFSFGSTSSNITPEIISQQYSGGFAIMTIIIFYGTMFATIVVAQLATVLYLLRLSPKKILM